MCHEDHPLHRLLFVRLSVLSHMDLRPACRTGTHTHTHAPWQQCLSCPVRVEDYIGASNGGSSEIVVADDEKYVFCVFEFFSQACRITCMPAGIEAHCSFPSGTNEYEQEEMGDMHVPCSHHFSDVLQQDKYYHLFLFLHARACQISCIYDFLF